MVNINLNSEQDGVPTNLPSIQYRGQLRVVVFTADAQRCIQELVRDASASGDRVILDQLARLAKLLQKLCNAQLRSPEEFVHEHENFYAVRPMPLRAYGWFEGRAFVVSHVIKKDFQKLRKVDKRRMENNKNSYVAPVELRTPPPEPRRKAKLKVIK